jgi:iron complex outermembrane receptor protein
MTRLIRAVGAALMAVFVFASCRPGGAYAQDAPSDTSVVPIPGVVVTGTRVPESVLRIPAAVTLVERREFAAARNINLKDALGFVPGVFSQSRGGAQDLRITIRGFGARGSGDRSNTGGTRGIRILSDGLPLTEPDGRTSLDFADLGNADRVEVSRSNVSALYGNASGGVIQLRTDYSFDRPWFEVSERAGSFGYHREQGRFGFTVGRGRGSLTIQNSTFDGWREHSMSTQVLGQGRFHVPLDDQTQLGIVLDGVSNLNRYPGALTRAEMDSFPEMANPTFVARDERRRNRVARVGMTLDRQIEEKQNFSIAAFVEPKVLQRSERNVFRDFTRYHVGGSATWQIQGNLGSGGMHGTATIGVDDQYQDGAVLFYDLTADGGRGSTLMSNQREGSNSGGGFIQGELRWGEHWSVRAAVRYDNLKYISEDHMNPALDATEQFDQWTPKGSIAT